MNKILLNNAVIVYLLSESILYLLLLVAAIVTVGLVRKWDFDAFTATQFALENRSYLVMTIILFAMILKMALLPYFVYTIDALCELVPGAMCGAGVIKANAYGNPLLALKIVTLFLSGLWLTVNTLDLKAKNYPYLKYKSWFFLLLFGLFTLEMVLDILYFTHIETAKPVTCCSVIFGQNEGLNPLPLGLDIPKLLWLFYLLYTLIVLTLLAGVSVMVIVSSLLFIAVGYYAVVYFFGTYIYQLPTHKCPFCMLQDHYYYVGYAVWGLLLLGSFFAIDYAVMRLFFGKSVARLKRFALLLLTLFVLLCSSYVVLYYLNNGVWL